MRRIVIGITGASGAQLGYAVLQALRAQDTEIHLVLSDSAKHTMALETDLTPADFGALADYVYAETDRSACIASGSYPTDGMVVVPCSMKTLSAIANAYDVNLLVRAADVCMKERRKLVLVPRETPLNSAHLRNLLTLSQDGAVILPPLLSFYLDRQDLQAQLDQITGKILQQFGLDHPGMTHWQSPPGL